MRNANNLEQLKGRYYRQVLSDLISTLQPRTYFEIGTLTGDTMKDVTCDTISVDPFFQISQDVIGSKKRCYFFQLPSDQFFRDHSPEVVFGAPIDFAFLDGMHRCEFLLRDVLNTERHCTANSVIALHDCVPTEWPMTDRVQERTPSIDPDRTGWWTGDVWRTVLALKHFRPDLRVMTLDASPTGLVLITNLNPMSEPAAEYPAMVDYMMGLSSSNLSIADMHQRLGVVSTSLIDDSEKIQRYFWL